VTEEQNTHVPLGARIRRLLTLNIGGKIILPYVILTWIVASVGLYVVSSLVVSSIDERMTNQLFDAGGVVSDSLVLQEREHIESARAVAYTVGLAEALQDGDRERVQELAQPAGVAQGVECMIVTDGDGQEMLQILVQDDDTYRTVDTPSDTTGLWMVESLLEAGDPAGLPQRGLALHYLNDRYYYFTAVPVPADDQVAGVVVVGTTLDTLLRQFYHTALAHVTIQLDGHAIASTFTLSGHPAEVEALLDQLSLTPEMNENVLSNQDIIIGENSVVVHNDSYRVAHSVLKVGNSILGTFSVALPSNFIVEQRVTTRNTYVFLFALATTGVFALGYGISRLITNPLGRLVRTSQAVAEGDLQQRTGIVSGDEIGYLAATFDEMTGRLAERTRALEETLSRLRAILSSIGDGVLLEDLDKNLIPLNETAKTLLEEMQEQALVAPLRELSSTDFEDAPSSQDPWLLERRNFEVGKKVVSAHAAAVRTEGNEYLGTVIVLRDVTAEVEAEQLKDSFVAHVSHELRTPLTAIKGYSELMLTTSDSLTTSQQGFLKAITRHTDSLVAMINALLDFSEVEAWNTLKLHQQPIQPATIIEEIADEWRSHIEEKELEFRVNIPDDLPEIDGDARRLRWAITNLVRNAWQYTPEGGQVTIQLTRQNGKIVLDVSDTGLGISAETQSQLFSRFYRAQEVTTGDTRGIGLGLYVTKVIVEAHGGEVQLSSQEDVGSTFSIILPIAHNDLESDV